MFTFPQGRALTQPIVRHATYRYSYPWIPIEHAPPSGLVVWSNRDIGLMNRRFLSVRILYDLPVLESLDTITPVMSHLDVFVLYILTLVLTDIGRSSFAVLSYSVLVFSAICLFRSVALLMSSRGTNPILRIVGR